MLCHGPPGLIKELQRNDKFDLAVLRARHERLMATAHKLWDQPTAAIIKPTTKRAKWKQKGEEILPASVQFQFWATESSRCIHVNNSRHCHGEPMTKLLEYVRLRKEGYTHCNTRGCFNRIAAKDVLKQAGLDPKIADD